MVHSQLRRNRSVVNLVNLVNLTRFPSEITGAALTLLALEGIIDYMRSCIANGKAILSLLGLLCVQSVNLCAGTLSATAMFTDTQVSPGVYQYDLTLNDTGTTTIGTFWFAWIPGDGFMTVTPTAIQSPSGWTEIITNGGAIQWVDSGTLGQGSSQSGFEFNSTLTPSQLEDPSVIPTDPVATSFVYIGAPFGDPGFQLVATPAQAPVPEPATILLTALGIGFAGISRKLSSRLLRSSR